MQLQEQRSFLRSSCQSYDLGNVAEAKRLAGVIYTLAYDGPSRTKSLLGQLKIKTALVFVSTATQISQENLLSSVPLAFVGDDGNSVCFKPSCFHPKQHEVENGLAFSKWWEEPIYKEPSSNRIARTLTRKNLVCNLRDQDGGSHVDAELTDELYTGLGYKDSTAYFRVKVDGTQHPVPYAHLASMRQIAWELEYSLSDVPGGPELPPLGIDQTVLNRLNSQAQSAPEVEPATQLENTSQWQPGYVVSIPRPQRRKN